MTTSYIRGAFIAYEPDGYPDRSRMIPFRFNPETVARQLSIEQGQSGQGTNAGGASGSSSGGTSGNSSGRDQGAADAASGALKHTLTVQVRFDFADRHTQASDLDESLGIAPEIAAVEDLLHPAASETEQPNQGGEPVQQRPRRPTVLLVWGKRRVYPVRITQMTINESVYNADLNPVRAEIEVAMEVLSDADASDNRAVADALTFTRDKRREDARRFLDRTAEQSTSAMSLWERQREDDLIEDQSAGSRR